MVGGARERSSLYFGNSIEGRVPGHF